MHAGGDHQQIVGIFIQVVIRFGKQRQAGRVPDNLVDPDHMRLKVVKSASTKPRPGSCHQKNRAAVHRAHVNRAVKRNREPRLQIESVQLVQQR